MRPLPLLFFGLATAGSAMLVVSTAHHQARLHAGSTLAALATPMGVSHDGDALPFDHPLLALADDPDATPAMLPGASPAMSPDMSPGPSNAAQQDPSQDAAAGFTPLALRQRCAWGQPGRSPYQGTVEQALNTARLPAEIVKQIASKVRAHDVTDRLVISNAAIRTEAGQRQFDPRSVVMTYGHTLCLATRVNFKPGHEERADLYQVADRSGKRYSVMVPDVCGNVSVLAERGEELPVKVLAAAQAFAESPAQRDTVEITPDGAFRDQRIAATTASVPEPGTLASVVLGLALLGWSMRRRK